MQNLQASVAFDTTPVSSDPTMGFVLEMGASALEQPDFTQAATALTSELALKLGCSRVSIGIRGHNDHRICAMSHSVEEGGKYQIHRELADLMDEATDQAQAVVFPESDEFPGAITHAHSSFAQRHSLHSVFTLPLHDNDQAFGAVVFEWSSEPTQIEVRPLVHLCTLVGPILAAKYAADHPWRTWRKRLRKNLSRKYNLWLTTALALIALALLGLATIETTYRVSTDVMIEAEQQRTLVAPMDGFIAAALRRAGDTVSQGEELGSLERRELELEREKLVSQLQQTKREYRGALATQDRTQTAIYKARMEQARAQLALSAEQIKRTRLVSPIDGYVVNGDLSQAIGTPVTRGDTLFQIAPLGKYRVILKVDERDADFITEQQQGSLLLTGTPNVHHPIRVKRLTPVAVTEEGRNFFRVEAELLDPPAQLRPGMTGAAKIEAGDRTYVWILTHRLVDWLLLTFWDVKW